MTRCGVVTNTLFNLSLSLSLLTLEGCSSEHILQHGGSIVCVGQSRTKGQQQAPSFISFVGRDRSLERYRLGGTFATSERLAQAREICCGGSRRVLVLWLCGCCPAGLSRGRRLDEVSLLFTRARPRCPPCMTGPRPGLPEIPYFCPAWQRVGHVVVFLWRNAMLTRTGRCFWRL